ncbi:MAG: hypothetical protein AAGC55_22590, partial [Myxococcota bacterium]
MSKNMKWYRILCATALTTMTAVAGCAASDEGQVQDYLAANCSATVTHSEGEVQAHVATDGSVVYQITLNSQANYVELFARKNTVQHLAQNITASAQTLSDGRLQYSFTEAAGFYTAGDTIEFRVYAVIPTRTP